MSELQRYALRYSMRDGHKWGMYAHDSGTHYRREDVDAEFARLREALGEISKGAGPFSHDPLTHARDCIECMKATAAAALWDAPDG